MRPLRETANWILLAGLLCLATGCATPVGVTRLDARAVHQTLTSNVLSTAKPSPYSNQQLHRLDLFDKFTREPDAVLEELHSALPLSGGEDLSFTLAELSFLRAEEIQEPSYYLAAASYAYAFLFPGTDGIPPDPADPRFRLAIDLYNRGLTAGLTPIEGKEVLLEGGRHELPFGYLNIMFDQAALTRAGYRIEHFVPAAVLDVRGLRNRYRRPGIGASLVASLSEGDSKAPVEYSRLPDQLKVPITVFLRFSDVRRGIIRGKLRGTLELYTPDVALSVTIGDREVPLEFEISSVLAYNLEGASVWDFELAGFRSGDTSFFRTSRSKDGLFILNPHLRGRIPLVLIHGTASSPARWAEMINELASDPRIWGSYEIWLFIYNTGNPVAYSAANLRLALSNTVSELDPPGTDPALRRMVLIGHSQGGLLAKMMVIDSGTRFWDSISRVPLAELDLQPETRELLGRSLFFKPLPFVRRVIFIATPHRGSYLAGTFVRRLVSRIVKLPGKLTRTSEDLSKLDKDNVLLESFQRIPNSVDNMSPGHPFIKNLSSIPISEQVTAHSIIAVKGEGPLEEETDGVVKYESAHIDRVASEKVVQSGHSTQSNPRTIEEVRRILLEHLNEAAATK